MIRLALSPEEQALLEQTRRTRPHLAERCHYVLLNAQGWSVPQIARRLNRNEHTIRTWLKAYRGAGLPGLHNTPQSGRPATIGQRVSDHIEQLLAHGPSHFGYIEDGWTVDLVWLKISAASTPLKFPKLGVYCTYGKVTPPTSGATEHYDSPCFDRFGCRLAAAASTTGHHISPRGKPCPQSAVRRPPAPPHR